ncbi:MAG: lipopolysaccharide biosynthesis protein [Alistipes sp.]|nr:lipopolysaccharide biosynthesis protein [Alistipes sp.]MBP3474070.1 lipopolysaccharide biosynthesis protein [Alistipes sp.]MBR3793159.1 lipopolysaccharide biosynthesis protein [Alistipes sp.]
MNQLQNQINNIPEEKEIDLVELIRLMWLNRWLVIKITGVAMVLGLMVALFSKKEYTASCDIVLQSSSGSTSSSMSSLAALAGINIGQMQNNVRALSPYVYENILNSTSYRKELMYTVMDFEKADRPVSFYEYFTSEEFNKPGVMDYVKKYTIGLPGVIIGAIRGPQPESEASAVEEGSAIETLTSEEASCVSLLSKAVVITLDDKKGYITITANMPEPVAAAQLAQAAFDILQKYITKFKIEKVQSDLDFVQERYDEAKRNFEEVQARRAKLRDANMNTTRYSALAELEKLDAEYALRQGVYNSLAQRVEQAKINVKETTPVLTVINPVTVPRQKSKPRRAMILFAFTFLGAVAGMGTVLVLPTVAEITGKESLKRFIKTLPEESVVA